MFHKGRIYVRLAVNFEIIFKHQMNRFVTFLTQFNLGSKNKKKQMHQVQDLDARSHSRNIFKLSISSNVDVQVIRLSKINRHYQ